MPIDYREYPPDWPEIRERILTRAGQYRSYTGDVIREAHCEWCGAENHSVRNGSMVVLTIAHLDHDHANWEVADDRLAALCQSCHLTYDAPRHHEKRRRGLDEKRGQLQLLDRETSMELILTNHYGRSTH